MADKTCCVTGHRDIPSEQITYVEQALQQEVLAAIAEGYTRFISGFAEELIQLLSGKSMIRYFPPNATAGFATFAVRTPSLLPCPPASSIAIISFFIMSSPLCA